MGLKRKAHLRRGRGLEGMADSPVEDCGMLWKHPECEDVVQGVQAGRCLAF